MGSKSVMTYNRNVDTRIVSHRQMFSRRSLVGAITGMILGFNIASWFIVPTPSRTDIEIEVIAGGNVKNRRNVFPELRVEIARVKSGNKHKIIEAESMKRQKRLELFDKSDFKVEKGEAIPKHSKRLKDFQFPANAPKYVDYGGEASFARNDRNAPFGENKLKVTKQSERMLGSKDRKHFIYIGVLTAQKFLATRGRAIMNTWAKKVPGKVEFYVGEGVQNVNDGEAPLPLVKLPTVKDNSYPPQKKSFLMLKRMYKAYLNSGYQWFMRADDDIYIKTEKLEQFLRGLNNSQPIFLGQTGLGNAEERGRLSLPHGDNFCMGGPGMIFSREVLRRVGPHIRDCVKHLYTWHEDVELSRCVRRFAGVNCAWSYQVQELFYEHYTLRKGYIDPYIDSDKSKLYTAFTLHPNKNPQFQVKLHIFMTTQKMVNLITQIKKLSRDLLIADQFLGKTSDMEDYMLGIPLSLNRLAPRKREDVRTWEFMTDKLLYSFLPNQARRSMSSDKQIAVKDAVMHVMQIMNANAKSRGRTIEFKQVVYGYQRTNPVFGAEYVLDLLLQYKRFKGKKANARVRRHLYLQQTFAKTLLHEPSPLDVKKIRALSDNARPGVVSLFFNYIFKKSAYIFSAFRHSWKSKPDSHIMSKGFAKGSHSLSLSNNDIVNNQAEESLDYYSSQLSSFRSDVTKIGVPVVHIIIPLKGRFETFQSFMTNLEKVCLLKGDRVSLLIILFMEDDPTLEEESSKTTSLLNAYAKRYSNYDLRVVNVTESFSRGLGLEIGASHFSNNSLLFFCDIDVVFDEHFTRKCRSNTALGSKVYYPILFSQFHPNFSSVWSSREQFPDMGNNVQELKNASPVKTFQVRKDNFEIKSSTGYWRNFGYGLVCTYKKDFIETGGFDTTIKGWGMEDVDLVNKFSTRLQSGHKPHKTKDNLSDPPARGTINVHRAFEPSLVHVYHPSHCDVNLMENQLRMCRASRASCISSMQNLAKFWEHIKPKEVKDPVSDIIPLYPSSDRKRIDNKSSKTKEKLILRKFGTRNNTSMNVDGKRRFKRSFNEKVLNNS